MRRVLLYLILALLPGALLLRGLELGFTESMWWQELVIMIFGVTVSLLLFKHIFYWFEKRRPTSMRKKEIVFVTRWVMATIVMAAILIVSNKLYFREVSLPLAKQQLQEISETMKESHGIELRWDLDELDLAYTFSEVGKVEKEWLEARDFAFLLEEEFQKYPLPLIRDSKLKTIYLGNDILRGENPVGGFSMGPQRLLMFDFNEGSLHYRRGSIHHEMFHQLIAGSGNRQQTLAKWGELNPEGMEEVDSYDEYQKKLKYDPLFWRRHHGHVSSYGKLNHEEDMAVLYENLMASNRHRHELSVKMDLVLEKKKTFLEEWLRDTYGVKILVRKDIRLVPVFKKVPSSSNPEISL